MKDTRKIALFLALSGIITIFGCFKVFAFETLSSMLYAAVFISLFAFGVAGFFELAVPSPLKLFPYDSPLTSGDEFYGFTTLTELSFGYGDDFSAT